MLNPYSIAGNNLEEAKRALYQKRWDRDSQLYQFNQEKERARQIVSPNDLIRLNIGGKITVTRRETLIKVPNSLLAKTFDGTYQNYLRPNSDGTYFLDYNPFIFTRLLDQLRMLKTNETINFSPPLSSTLVKPFNKMLKELGLPLPKQSPNDIISLNVGGEKIVTLRKTLTSVPNSKLAQLISSTKGTKYDQLGQPFLDYNPKLFQHLLDQLRQGKNLKNKDLNLLSNENQDAFQAMLSDLREVKKSVSQPFLDYNPKLFQHLLDQLRQGKNLKNKDLNLLSNENQDAFQAMLSDLREVKKSKKARTNKSRKQKTTLNPSKTTKKN
ncbi:unnamed protein product [Adineta steineri]|uniref:Potassium channel tetramerisation-type BTB domain-containing protein n=1 Tax=Adineta steineri TaxID=433720 RepID=A0A814RQ93_9BILA|nr:unnamed protein product [Adineta steineri]